LDLDEDEDDGGLMAAEEGALNLRLTCSWKGRPSLCSGVGGSVSGPLKPNGVLSEDGDDWEEPFQLSR
jgi:hypothetical protein